MRRAVVPADRVTGLPAVEQIAACLALLDGRAVTNAEDWRLARIAKPHLDRMSTADIAAAQPVADALLQQMGVLQ